MFRGLILTHWTYPPANGLREKNLIPEGSASDRWHCRKGDLAIAKVWPKSWGWRSAIVSNVFTRWLASGRELRILTGHGRDIKAVAVTPDGRRAVSASEDWTLKVWELESGRELRTLKGHRSFVTAVAVTPDGQRAVSASEDRTLKVWDLATGGELRTLAGHSGGAQGAALNDDGRIAVSASDDNTVMVWDLETGACLATFTCDSAAQCCAYCDALKLILAGDAGGHVHFLRLEEPKFKR
jgi:WD40 repeat protein